MCGVYILCEWVGQASGGEHGARKPSIKFLGKRGLLNSTAVAGHQQRGKHGDTRYTVGHGLPHKQSRAYVRPSPRSHPTLSLASRPFPSLSLIALLDACRVYAAPVSAVGGKASPPSVRYEDLKSTPGAKTFAEMPPMYGRPPLSQAEIDAIESGGAI